MWRFIAITFAFLGWAFYVLSGGNDYAPGSNSLQAQTETRTANPVEIEVAELVNEAGDEADQPVDANTVSTLSEFEVTNGERFEITLASVTPSNEYDEESAAELEISAAAIDAAVQEANAADLPAEEAEDGATDANTVPDSVATGFVGEEVFSLETYVARQTGEVIQPVSTEETATPSYSGDIRSVTGNVVNMRAGPGTDYETVGTVGKGTQIAVLEEPGNGWIMLEVIETGEVAWMADWLVTASN